MRIFSPAAAAVAVCVALAPVVGRADGPGARTPLTAEQRERMLRDTGGPVLTPERGPWIALVDAQGTVPEETVAAEFELMRKVFRFPVHRSRAEGLWTDLARKALDEGAGVAVVIGEAAGLPSVLVAPSSQFALVNISALAADAPDAQRLAERFHKELLRALAYAFGAGESASRIGIMKPVRSVAELDALEGRNLGPETLQALLGAGRARKMEIQRMVPYKFAVGEGWAPPPSNEYQRTFWEIGQTNRAVLLPPKRTSAAPGRRPESRRP